MAARKTIETFGKELYDKWGTHITLCDKSVYVNNKTKIIVFCDKHGEIEQTPDNLLKHDCNKCSVEKITNLHRGNKEEFVEKSNKIHNNKYLYDKFVYVNNSTKGIITCPIHGDFLQTPRGHLSGKGCRLCANNNISNYRKDTFEDFVLKANKKHGSKYLYNEDTYVNSITKTKIVCPIHGEFMQLPSSHLRGAGCPYCKESKLEYEVCNFLKENKIDFIRRYTAEWLGKQHLDFYLPNYNIAIECQGIQHFEPREVFGGEKEFKLTVERDKAKIEKCIGNKVNLLFYGSKKYDEKNINTLYKLNNKILEIGKDYDCKH